MLKVDLHLHANEDNDHHRLSYTSKELIAKAAEQGFEVLALTFHGDVHYNKTLVNYAKQKNILLIPGIEKLIEKKEVLIYNITQKESKKLKTFDDLRKLKQKKNILIIAPHPYYIIRSCLGSKLEQNIDLFDAIEYSHYYLKYLNFNKKAVKIAKKYSIPMIGTSDTHYLPQLGSTYTIIDSKKNLKDIFKAIRNKQVLVKSKPIKLKYFIWRFFRMVLNME